MKRYILDLSTKYKMEELDDSQKYANYLFLLDAKETLEDPSQKHIICTSEWATKQIQYIQSVYYYYGSYGIETINEEIEDMEFRTRCATASASLDTLMTSIDSYGTFDIDTYAIFIRSMHFMIEFVLTESEIDTLTSMFKNNKIAK